MCKCKYSVTCVGVIRESYKSSMINSNVGGRFNNNLIPIYHTESVPFAPNNLLSSRLHRSEITSSGN